MLKNVWIFVGEKAPFPSGVFEELDDADSWIRKHRMSGVLTRYPVGTGVFEWVVDNGYVAPPPEKTFDGHRISRFSSAYLPHHHYEDGLRQGEAVSSASAPVTHATSPESAGAAPDSAKK